MKASMVCFLPSDFPDHFLITGRKDKAPLEKVKNLLDTLAQMIDACHRRAQSISDAKPKITFPGLETPVNRNIAKLSTDYEASVMKGVCCEYTDIFPFFLFIIYSLNYFPDIFTIYLFKAYYLEVMDIFLHFSH